MMSSPELSSVVLLMWQLAPINLLSLLAQHMSVPSVQRPSEMSYNFLYRPHHEIALRSAQASSLRLTIETTALKSATVDVGIWDRK